MFEIASSLDSKDPKNQSATSVLFFAKGCLRQLRTASLRHRAIVRTSCGSSTEATNKAPAAIKANANRRYCRPAASQARRKLRTLPARPVEDGRDTTRPATRVTRLPRLAFSLDWAPRTAARTFFSVAASYSSLMARSSASPSTSGSCSRASTQRLLVCASMSSSDGPSLSLMASLASSPLSAPWVPVSGLGAESSRCSPLLAFPAVSGMGAEWLQAA